MPYSSTTCAVVNWSYMIIIIYIYLNNVILYNNHSILELYDIPHKPNRSTNKL